MEALSRETLENMMEQAVAHATTVSFWPQGEAPGAKNSDAVFTPEPRHTGTSQYDRAVTGIRAPEITVYAPEKPNGVGILVTPGGSYRRVVMDKEGSVLAPFFNARGYTLFVMTYRMPGDGHEEGANAPLADAQRALFATQQALAQSQLAQRQNQVALYKALGGGWEVSSTMPSAAHSPTGAAAPTPRASRSGMPASAAAMEHLTSQSAERETLTHLIINRPTEGAKP